MKLLQILIAGILMSSASALSKTDQNPFFAIAFGFPDHTATQKVEFLVEAGYDRIADFVRTDQQLEHFKELVATPEVQNDKLKVFGVYMPLNIESEEQRALVSKVLKVGKTNNVPVWFTASNKKEDTPMETVVKYIQNICDEASLYGTNVILYPHDRHFAMSAEETIELIEAADRDNLYTTLHLNHELRAGNAKRLDEVVEKAAPYAKLASISGANLPGNYNRGSRDWSDVVQAVATSQFNIKSFYDLLVEHGYEGPIGYNNWKIPEPETHHVETLAIYKSWAN